MNSLRVVVSLAVLSTLFACPPDPKVVAEKTAKDTSALIREAWQTGEQTNDWQSVDKFFEGTFGVRRSRSGSAIYVPAVSNFDSASDTAGDAMSRVFDKGNVVKTEGGAVYFRVRGVDLCVDTTGLVNSSCADAIDRLTPQLKVSGDLDIAVLLGANQVEGAVFHLVSKKSISVDFDLAHARAVSELMQRAFNPSQPPVITGDATGKLQVKLEKNKDFDFTFTLSFLSDLNVSWQADSITSRSYFVQARTPALLLQVAAPEKRIAAKLNFGKLQYLGRGEELGFGANTTSIDAMLAGLTADFLFDDATYKLSNVGIGDTSSTIKAGATTLLQLDLNHALGRKADLEAVHTTDGLRVTAKPGLTIVAQTNFGALASSSFRVSEEMRNARYDFSFTSAATPTLDFFLRRLANGESGMPFTRLSDGTIKMKVDVLSPGTADNVAACNAMKNRTAPYEYWVSDCGGLTAPVDCSGLTVNEYENDWYLSCVIGSYECQTTWNSSTGVYDYSYSYNATRAADCQLLGNRSLPERTFTAPTCLSYDNAAPNSFVGFFTGTVACP